VKIVAQSDVSDPVLIHSPDLVRLNASFLDEADSVTSKKLLCAGKAR